MERESIALFGIPVDDLTMDSAIDAVFQMTDTYRHDEEPRYVATVNVDFIINTLSWRTSRSRHPELLNILRKADLVTPDGMPVIWASKLMDSPLSERVTGSDMVPAIAERAAKVNKSIFLFGGSRWITENAAEKLVTDYPGLKIAGTYTPPVATVGEDILDSSERDQEIVKMINTSGADILLIALGNPKQEIWFERNRSHLKVPVSIGIGGTFGFITGAVSRAPAWMQKSGLEWIHRIMQDPGRLWKRYFNGLVKLSTNILLPILIHKLIKTSAMLKRPVKYSESKTKKNIEKREDIAILAMPSRFTRKSASVIKERLSGCKESIILFDFSDTVFMDLYAMGFIVNTLSHPDKERSLFLTGINRVLISMLKFNRVWDICKDRYCNERELISERAKKHDNDTVFYYKAVSDTNSFRIELNGRLDAAGIAKLDISKIIESIGNRDCIMNLKNLKFIDSTGLIFFLKIKKHLSSFNRTPIICNLNDDIIQIFNITKLLSLFKIMPDFDSDKPLTEEAI